MKHVCESERRLPLARHGRVRMSGCVLSPFGHGTGVMETTGGVVAAAMRFFRFTGARDAGSA